jgi:hypothetical protein
MLVRSDMARRGGSSSLHFLVSKGGEGSALAVLVWFETTRREGRISWYLQQKEDDNESLPGRLDSLTCTVITLE